MCFDVTSMSIFTLKEKKSHSSELLRKCSPFTFLISMYPINQLVKLHKAEINSSYVFLLTVQLDQTLLICDMYANLDCYFACPQTCTVMCT